VKFPQCERCLFRGDGEDNPYCAPCLSADNFEPDFDAGQPDEQDDFECRQVIRLESE